MKIKRKLKQISALLLCLALHGSVTFRPSAAQEAQERDIEAKEVLRNRPQSKNPKTSLSYRYRLRIPATSRQNAQTVVGSVRSRKVTSKDGTKVAAQQFPVGPPPKGKAYATIGVTLWRGRLATAAESQHDKVVKLQVRGQEMVFERISDESPVTNGDLIQISIEYLSSEANRACYLYVVGCEQYPNGKKGQARLIFPTMRTFGGDNRVLPGKTVTLPDPKRPWQIMRSASGQVQAYETYTIILSPEPLELQAELSARPVELPLEQVVAWERQWGGSAVRADLQGNDERLLTQREQAASGNPNAGARDTGELDEDLTQDDPPPQIVFRKAVTPGSKMLVTVLLPYKEAASSKP